MVVMRSRGSVWATECQALQLEVEFFEKPHPVRHPVVVARGRRGGGPAQIQQKSLDLDKQHLRRRQVGAVKAVLLVRVLPACVRTERFGYGSFPNKNLESQNLAVPLSAPGWRRPGCTPCTASPYTHMGTSLLYAVGNTDECCAGGHKFCCQAGLSLCRGIPSIICNVG